jgi:hypothetical protein
MTAIITAQEHVEPSRDATPDGHMYFYSLLLLPLLSLIGFIRLPFGNLASVTL